MKAEINNENKAKFYAQYWGQEVLEVPHLVYVGYPPEPSHDEWGSETLRSDNIDQVVKHNFPLWLKPLSQISDEEAIELAKIIGCSGNGRGRLHPLDRNMPLTELGRGIVWSGRYVIDNFKMWDVIDYLRSKGYALPFMGLSVEEMIEAGWIKIKGGTR